VDDVEFLLDPGADASDLTAAAATVAPARSRVPAPRWRPRGVRAPLS